MTISAMPSLLNRAAHPTAPPISQAESSSDQNSFPVAVGPDVSHNGGVDAIVVKLAANGSSLAYAGYIGGVNDDRGNGIAVDSANSAHVTGETNSDQTSFPDGVGPDLTHNGAHRCVCGAAERCGKCS